MRPLNHLAMTALLAVGLLLTGSILADPLDNCQYKEDDTFMCEDRMTYCTEDLGLPAPMTDFFDFCHEDQLTFVDPEYPCDCKLICVEQLKEGDECVYMYATSYPTEMCGRGLDCLSVNGSNKFQCARNPNKPCVNETIQYEKEVSEGHLAPARLYPNCDDVGKYEGRQCSVSSTCYCVDKEGNRIFGEGAFTEQDIMDCKCSRQWLQNEAIGLDKGLRCLANGNFDPLQCNEDFCYCYNSTTENVIQGPYDISQIQQFDCYDPSYHKINYTNPCDRALAWFNEQNTGDSGGDIVIGESQKPNCSRDGYYDSIQKRGTEYFCSDKDGRMIEGFKFTASDMPFTTCNCATRRNLMREAGITTNLPDCCSNGNFLPYQSRGLYSYCVDINGDQQGDAMSATQVKSLPCYSSTYTVDKVCLN